MNKNKIPLSQNLHSTLLGIASAVFSILLSSNAVANDVALEFGPFGTSANGVIDGSGPFGTAIETASGGLETCPSDTDMQLEGADCGNANGVLRTQDIALHVFSVSATGGDPSIPITDTIIDDVVLELTAHPSTTPLAVVNVERIPSACTTFGGGGTNPPSSIVTNADNSVTLVCNLGGLTNGEAKFISVPIQASGLSHNGSSYTTTQRIYSTPNAATTTVNTYVDNTPILISGAPAWDITFSSHTREANSPTQSLSYRGTSYRDVGQGSELGFIVYGAVNVTASRKAGVEAVTEPLTFSIDFSSTVDSATGPSYLPEFYVDNCTVRGIGGVTGTTSGDCTYTRTDPNDNTSTQYDFTLTGSDLSGETYPTVYYGRDLSAGPYIATSHNINVWVPLRTIDLTDNILDNQGAIYMSGLISGFDPDSITGLSNYGSNNNEPGHDGDLMDNGDRSNNELGPRELLVRAAGGTSKWNMDHMNTAGTTATTRRSAALDAEKSPGQAVAASITLNNAGSVDLTNPTVCDVFDHTTLQLTQQSDVSGLSGAGYAFIGSYMRTIAATSIQPSDLIIEYANINIIGDDPLDNNGDLAPDFNSATGRYEGNWDGHKAARCNDADATSGWHTDPNAVTGGIDSVNAVRARQSETSFNAGLGLTPDQYMRLIIPIKVRSTFNGGPRDTQTMPYGTVMANFMSAKSDQWRDDWIGSDYNPSPQNNSTRGDRLTLSKVRLALDSNSLTPPANSGGTASTLAGNQIVWNVTTSVTTPVSGDVSATNVQIFSVIPPEASYNRSCTESQTGYTAPSLVQYNTDMDGNPSTGYTRLVWNLGNHPANTVIPPRIYCTDTDPLAPDSTAVTIQSLITADDGYTAQSLRHDAHTISLLQVGNVKMSKTVDAALDERNDDQVFTLSWANFSDSFEIEPGVMIDVLPYHEDNNTPQSSFSGDYQLTGEPTMSFLDGSVPDSNEDPIGTWYYTNDAPTGINPSPLEDTSNWCLAVNFGSGNPGCPTDFSGVTAVKMVSHHKMAVNGTGRQGVRVNMTIQAGDPTFTDPLISNQPSDQYTNKFTLGTPSLPDGQFLTSGSVTVWVASYSIGDLIFADMDGDGIYDPAVDFPAPDGTVVHLYQGDGTLIRTTTTGLEKAGRYLFTKVDKGDFYVEVPASEFQLGKMMQQWMPSGPVSDPNDNKNDHEDQHGYSPTSPDVDGIRSGIITMDADAATPGGGVPLGREPTSDNTGFLTNDTLDDFSNYGLDLAMAPQSYTVSGTVWSDINKDSIRQNSELGLPGVNVVLYGFVFGNQDSMVCESVATDANGFYQFSVLSGDYQIIEAANAAVPIDSATCPPTESDPAGYISTTPNTRNFTIYQANLQRQDFGDYVGFTLSGKVFDDNGTGGGTSGNNTQDGNEPGISGVTIVASDGNGTEYATAMTATDGTYSMSIPGSATNVVVTEQNKSGYASVGGSPGSALAGSYNLASDSIRFPITTQTYTGLDFADIQKPTLMPDNTGTVAPGNFVNYPHRFTTPVAGTVVFSSVSELSTTPGWSSTVYQDDNCDGLLDASESIVAGQSVSVNADETICLINKVNSPSAAFAQESNRATITATFEDASASTSSVLTVKDITTVTTDGASTLVIRKSVQNITQGTPATETSNNAKPGDELRYRITYRNTGTAGITDVVIKDVVPVFTTYVAGSANCDSTPTGMSCTPTVTGNDIDWTVANELLGLESGQVSYEVTVDN